MIRIASLLADLLLPLYLFFEIFVPWWRQKRLFPLTRTAWSLFGLLFRQSILRQAADERLRQAEARLVAAKRDLDAAKLEAHAENLEEETNQLREERNRR